MKHAICTQIHWATHILPPSVYGLPKTPQPRFARGPCDPYSTSVDLPSTPVVSTSKVLWTGDLRDASQPSYLKR